MLEKASYSRRDFLRVGIGVIGSVVSAVLAVPIIGYFLSPTLTRKKVDWSEVGPITDLKVGEPTYIEYSKWSRDAWVRKETKAAVWVVTKDSQNFTVFDPRCTHLGCLVHWKASTQTFNSPCHGGVFAIDGKVLAGPPPRPLDRYEYKVENGKLYVGKLYRVVS